MKKTLLTITILATAIGTAACSPRDKTPSEPTAPIETESAATPESQMPTPPTPDPIATKPKLPKIPPSIVPEATPPIETAQPPEPPKPIPAATIDPESSKRDDLRIQFLNDIIAKVRDDKMAQSQMALGASMMPCPPSTNYQDTKGNPLTPQPFSLAPDTCDTVLFKDLSDGLLVAVGIEDATKANLDTRKIQPLAKDGPLNDITVGLGSVSPDTPAPNRVYVAYLEQPGKPKERLMTQGASHKADLMNISMAMEAYFNDHGQYPDGSGCLSENGSGKTVVDGIKGYLKGGLVPTPAHADTQTLNCIGSYFYQPLDFKGRIAGSYVLVADMPWWGDANYELPPSLDNSLFINPEAIQAKIVKRPQESPNPLQSVYVLIP